MASSVKWGAACLIAFVMIPIAWLITRGVTKLSQQDSDVLENVVVEPAKPDLKELVRQANASMDEEDWAAAESILVQLESLYPDDRWVWFVRRRLGYLRSMHRNSEER